MAAGHLSVDEVPAKQRSRDVIRRGIAAQLAQRAYFQGDAEDPQAALRACLAWLAASPADSVIVGLEDLWLERRPQNVPGTSFELPNWRRRFGPSMEQLEGMPEVDELLALVARERRKAAAAVALVEPPAPMPAPSRLSADDLYLFNEGSHLHLFEKLGAHPETVDGVAGTVFAVWAPNAERVSVVGDFNGWDPERDPMETRGDSGIWEAFVPDVGKGRVYKYRIVSHHQGYRADKADPFAFFAERAPATGSVVWDLEYQWHDEAWMAGRAERNAREAPISIYELHIGSWRRVPEEGDRPLTYREMAVPLADHLERLGFTHVEFLPVMEHPFYGSWGYQSTGYFAPTSRYGTPQDFMFLVDYLHQRGIGVIVDWVPSHFPTDAHALGYFDGTHLYEHEDPRQGFHPDWGSFIFNYDRHEVRSFLLSSAFFWLERYHIDGLRVDAVASMLYLDYSRKEGEWIPNRYGGRENLGAIELLRRLNMEVYSRHPDVQTYAEESTAWPMVSKPVYVGGLGFGLKWDMGWMHDTLAYFAYDPVYRRYHHHELTFRLLYAFTENFVLPLSHDEVVHGKGSLLGKMPGDDWQKFANLRLLYGYMFAQTGQEAPLHGRGAGPVAGVEPRLEPRLAPARLRPARRGGTTGGGPQRTLRGATGAARAGPGRGGLRVGGRRRHRAERADLPAPGPPPRGHDPGRLQLHAGAPAGLPGGSPERGSLAGSPQHRREPLRRKRPGQSGPDRGAAGAVPRPALLLDADTTAAGRRVPATVLGRSKEQSDRAPSSLPAEEGVLENRNVFLLFVGGTLISLAVFAGMTWDTHRQVAALTHADKLSEQVVAGKHVWQDKECNLCHTILGFGGYYAPDLTRVYKRIGAPAGEDELVPFASQRVAYWYFLAALILFVLQLLVGLWIAGGYAFTYPQSVVDALPWGLTRAMHTNLLVLWMLLGFMGGTYYLVPEETEREIYSVPLAYLQLAAFLVTGVTALIGFAFGWTQGKPILEIPVALDWVVVIGALIFLFNVGMTVWKGRKTAVLGMLVGGLVFLALLYLFGMPFYRNLSTDWYYWWWVVHLWVEGAWELVTASILAFLLIKVTGVERRVIEKYLYIEAGLFMFSGIAGTGHHYYWLGAPRLWLWIGGIFSALEIVPIIAMVIDTFLHQRRAGRTTRNKVVWTFIVGTAVGHMVGAGLWGFAHTLPQINRFTHGSQITASQVPDRPRTATAGADPAPHRGRSRAPGSSGAPAAGRASPRRPPRRSIHGGWRRLCSRRPRRSARPRCWSARG